MGTAPLDLTGLGPLLTTEAFADFRKARRNHSMMKRPRAISAKSSRRCSYVTARFTSKAAKANALARKFLPTPPEAYLLGFEEYKYPEPIPIPQSTRRKSKGPLPTQLLTKRPDTTKYRTRSSKGALKKLWTPLRKSSSPASTRLLPNSIR
ncbi:MAG: hypothetical protein Q9180_000934 [Flavoplaca navasiana]